MITLQQLIKEIKNLKPIPAVASQLMTIVDDPDHSMEDISNVIQYDPMITASVLRTCNSAYFGLRHPAESIRDAVSLLGTDQIVELALVKSGAQVLGGKQDGYGLEKGDMWAYSVSSAVIAREIAIRLSLENRNTIFTSALIKDIGKVILERHVSHFAKQIRNLVESEAYSFREAEKQILGIDHTEIGAMIAKMWKFSPKMVNIIRHHHLADEAMIQDREISAVYLADCICMMTGFGVGSDGLTYRFRDQVMEELGITADDVSMILADFVMRMQEIEVLLQMG